MPDFLAEPARQRDIEKTTAECPADDLLAAAWLFQEDYYLAEYPELADASLCPLEHFLMTGARDGRRPNPYFEPLWYAEQNPGIRESGINPLVHYVRHGDFAGRSPSPWFDTAWYREHYQLRDHELALLHYLQRREADRYNPIPEFDAEYYLRQNPDVGATVIDPFIHFMESGWREWRNPSAAIDLQFYARRYMAEAATENPLLHYRRHKSLPGVYRQRPAIPQEARRFTRPGPDFEPLRPLPASAARKARLLAYYLPQFHPIPENDAWWGPGFTEWTNVVRGLPRFLGHYQPRVPRDLGFYSLDCPQTMERQIDLAQGAGIDGFVFYYYWFNGRRLLHKPVDRFLASPALNLNFALMWTNENWTRRWDGHDDEVLISQDYRAADEEALLADFARHFADARYIRLAQRPLLMVYRPGKIPDAAETFIRWRRIFAERHGEDPIIIMSQGFGDLDPRVFGLDGAIEFPPHKLADRLEAIEDKLERLDLDCTTRVHRYDDLVAASVRQEAPEFPLIRTAMPSWDNDARQPGAGTVFAGSTPAKYEAWLSQLVSDSAWPWFFGEHIVCVNAWNEWTEAAYLEPDQHYGAAYLNATGRAVAGLPNAARCRLLLIGHDAHQHGAQENLVNIGRGLRDSFGVALEFLLLEGGLLVPRYEAIAKTTIVDGEAQLAGFLDAAQARDVTAAIVNTTAAARVVKPAAARGIACTLLVHELPHFIHERKLATGAREALRYCRHVVFPAAFVRDQVLQSLDASLTDKAIVHPQGRYKPIDFSAGDADRVRRQLGLAQSDKLALGVGFGGLRKGFDLFIRLWQSLRDAPRRTHFVWVGQLDPDLQVWLGAEVEAAVATGSFHVVDFTEDIAAYYSAADAFALTSREDPYPAVVVEALSAGVPVVAFDRAGGIPEMLREHNVGVVVPYCDVTAMAAALSRLLQVPQIPQADRAARRLVVDSDFAWTRYVRRLLDLALPGLATVSVAVPNYNYGHYLAARLGSIFSQSYPVHEILVLDDGSTDDSLPVITAVQEEWHRNVRLVVNQQNSGSAFAQWRQAAQLAEGEFLWIAEADDSSDADFLSCLCAALLADPSIRFAFADSRAVDRDDRPLNDSYKPYYSTVAPAALAQSQVFAGREFVERFLSVKNLILNVSAVLWRREALLRALEHCRTELPGFRLAGDWRLYIEALSEPGAKVAYEARPLNVHRRHAQSVTQVLDARHHVEEIARIHAITRGTFRLDALTCEAQVRYIAEIREQLGVTADPAPETVGDASSRSDEAALPQPVDL